jgi:hypothetical protein
LHHLSTLAVVIASVAIAAAARPAASIKDVVIPPASFDAAMLPAASLAFVTLLSA